MAPFKFKKGLGERMHEHTECEHKLKYCRKCDVAYCEKCGKQWDSYTMTVTYPTWYYTNTSEYNTRLDHTHGS